MQPSRKESRQYIFTVEGETEKWYLEWLQQTINIEPSAKYRVSIKCKVEKNPFKFAKSYPNISKVNMTHWFDYESHEAEHGKHFLETLNLLKRANTIRIRQ